MQFLVFYVKTKTHKQCCHTWHHNIYFICKLVLMDEKEEADNGRWKGQDALDLSAMWSMETKQSSSDPLHTCYRSNHCIRSFTCNATHTLVHICFAHFYYSSFFLFFQLIFLGFITNPPPKSETFTQRRLLGDTCSSTMNCSNLCLFFARETITNICFSINGTLSAYFHRTNTTFHRVRVRVEIKRYKLHALNVRLVVFLFH